MNKDELNNEIRSLQIAARELAVVRPDPKQLVDRAIAFLDKKQTENPEVFSKVAMGSGATNADVYGDIKAAPMGITKVGQLIEFLRTMRDEFAIAGGGRFVFMGGADEEAGNPTSGPLPPLREAGNPTSGPLPPLREASNPTTTFTPPITPSTNRVQAVQPVAAPEVAELRPPPIPLPVVPTNGPVQPVEPVAAPIPAHLSDESAPNPTSLGQGRRSTRRRNASRKRRDQRR